jgi:hypothetical protein
MSEDNRDPVRAALEALVSKLELIQSDAEFNGVWTYLAAHGIKYTGPTWNKELAAARAAISTPAPEWKLVAWCDPLDVQEEQISFYGCSYRYRMGHDGLRYSLPLYTKETRADPPKEPPPIKETR